MQIIYKTVGIVGTGAMGRGIAQIATQAGSVVKLMDAQAGAAEKAREAICSQWDKLVEKGRIDAGVASAHKARLRVAGVLAELSDCDLVIEAIVERLDIKKTLFAELEAIVSAHTVLASNTSSLSVTAIAAGLKHPERFAGYHFFNPVPLMKVVEVIAGLKTGADACHGLSQYARQMGHTPVQAQDTPGFIVNHAGRGYGTEALRIVSEGIADFATIDRILRDQAGFKLGPFEFMDLTGLDVSHPVMESIYHQYYEEDRYRPSVITAQRLAGCWAVKPAKAFTAMKAAWRKFQPKPPFPKWQKSRPSGCHPGRPGVRSCCSFSKTLAPRSKPASRHHPRR